MKYYLYKFSDNWADEMDLEGFAILTEDEKDVALATIKRSYRHGGTVYFGTNEENEYNSLRDVMDTIEFSEITRDEYNSIKKLLGTTFGELGPLDTDCLDEEEEEEIEHCENCGEELEDGDDTLCDECREEEEGEDEEESFNSMAFDIAELIKKTYGIEYNTGSGSYADFSWKPTPKSEIKIIIPEWDGTDDEEIELSLNFNGKEIAYEIFKLVDIHCDRSGQLERTIKELITKAQKRQ